MASDSPLGIDEVFLGSCKEVSETLSVGSPVSPTITHVTLSPIAYKFSKLSFDEDKEAAISDMECLSAFYTNAIYDFYGTPSGALCIYKNGDAWPIRTGPESQWIIREACGVYGVSSVSVSTPCLTTRRFVGPCWTPLLSQRRGRQCSARSSFGLVSSPSLSPSESSGNTQISFHGLYKLVQACTSPKS